MSQPSTAVTRLAERQRFDRAALDAVLDSTPLATVAFVRDGAPVALPIGAARLGDHLVIHGSTGSPWLRVLATGVPVSVCVSTLDGIVLARSGFESSFHYRSAVLFGGFEIVPDAEKDAVLRDLLDTFIPGRSAELRPNSSKELAATLALRLPIGPDNWSVKVAGGWPEDDAADVAAGGWAGVVPILTTYGRPDRAPDSAAEPPTSVQAMSGGLTNRRR